MTWGWETFPQYIDVLARREQRPAAAQEAATMAKMVREAIEGAAGFSTSLINGHQAEDGRPVPGTTAAPEELLAIAREIRKAGKGVFEVIPSGAIGQLVGIKPDTYSLAEEWNWMRRFAGESQRPITFTLIEVHSEPEMWPLSPQLRTKGGQRSTRGKAPAGARHTDRSK